MVPFSSLLSQEKQAECSSYTHIVYAETSLYTLLEHCNLFLYCTAARKGNDGVESPFGCHTSAFVQIPNSLFEFFLLVSHMFPYRFLSLALAFGVCTELADVIAPTISCTPSLSLTYIYALSYYLFLLLFTLLNCIT
jgi:hypothetical protein